MQKIITTLFIFLIITTNSFAEEVNTFPVEDAGISAYTKIDDPGRKMMTKALSFSEEIIENEPTHIIISLRTRIEIESISENNIITNVYPFLYLNTDGWMVAYFPKKNPSSKIMQWTNYSPGNLNSTILEEVIEEMVENINTSYSEEIKYYHFKYPNANRMTLVAETVYNPEKETNHFSVTVPGIIHEASYSFYYSFRNSLASPVCSASLSVDNQISISHSDRSCRGRKIINDYYDSGSFRSNVAHLVSLNLGGRVNLPFEAGAATIFIYQVN